MRPPNNNEYRWRAQQVSRYKSWPQIIVIHGVALRSQKQTPSDVIATFVPEQLVGQTDAPPSI